MSYVRIAECFNKLTDMIYVHALLGVSWFQKASILIMKLTRRKYETVKYFILKFMSLKKVWHFIDAFSCFRRNYVNININIYTQKILTHHYYILLIY